jgi:hypothetical protein
VPCGCPGPVRTVSRPDVDAARPRARPLSPLWPRSPPAPRGGRYADPTCHVLLQPFSTRAPGPLVRSSTPRRLSPCCVRTSAECLDDPSPGPEQGQHDLEHLPPARSRAPVGGSHLGAASQPCQGLSIKDYRVRDRPASSDRKGRFLMVRDTLDRLGDSALVRQHDHAGLGETNRRGVGVDRQLRAP